MNRIKIVQGNDLPLCKKLTTIVNGAVTPIQVSEMSELRVLYGTGAQNKATEISWEEGEDPTIIHFRLESTDISKLGLYNVWIVGKYGVNDVVVSYGSAIEVVEWSSKTNVGEYIYTEEQALDDSIFIPAGVTDAELEELKRIYAAKAQEAEQAKEAYEQSKSEFDTKAEQITGVSQEVTLTQGISDIKAEIAKNGTSSSGKAFESMKQMQEYLYRIEYNELDWEAARKYFETHDVSSPGSCTALRKGNIIGRNYDWNYNKNVEFLVSIKAHNGKYASIGMATSVEPITTDTVGEYSELYKYLPFHMLDGINEKGLVCNVNVLNNDSTRSLPISGTTPIIEERESICSYMLCRYILDNFATAKEACEYIANYVRVYPPKNNGETIDLHFAIYDQSGTYYLAFEPILDDFRSVYRSTEYQEGGVTKHYPFVMTNFRLYDTSPSATSFIRTDMQNGIEKYGMGIERMNIGLIYVNNHQTTQSVLSFMCNDMKYTNLYTGDNWYTEFTTYNQIARNADISLFVSALTVARMAYQNRSRETGETWHTVHTAAYNIDTKSIELVTQESGIENAVMIDCFDTLPTTKSDISVISDAIPTLATKSTSEDTNRKAGSIQEKIGEFTDPGETVAHKLENITFDKSDLAKQGADTTATNTAILNGINDIKSVLEVSYTDVINELNA